MAVYKLASSLFFLAAAATTVHAASIPDLGQGFGHAATTITPVTGPVSYFYGAAVAGHAPLSLIQGHDGYLYGVNLYQGLNNYGTAFCLATDGSSYETLTAFPFQTLNGGTNKVDRFMDDDNGNIELLASPQAAHILLVDISRGSPLTTTVTLSPSTATAGHTVEIFWSSTDADTCALISDISGVSGAVATNGSQSIVLPPLHGLHTPPIYTVGLQCRDTDNNVSNATTNILVQ